ncbi:hypothetical protein ASF41_15780 [Methylobacterium sp. Leaf111]|nr:hypothetical protein ASF41_15780 [Methylobacterium sp. Leaf111]
MRATAIAFGFFIERLLEKTNDPEPRVDGPAIPPRRAAFGRAVHGVSTLTILGLRFGLTLAWVVFLCWVAHGVLRLIMD